MEFVSKEEKCLVKKIQLIFKDATLAKRDKHGKFEDILWEKKVTHAIAESRKNYLKEFIDDIFPYLKYPEEYIQEEVINTLGRKFRLPCFRDECFKIFKDMSRYTFIRNTALFNWIVYYSCTYDIEVIKILYDTLIDNNEDTSDLKLTAYYGIFSVCCIPGEKVADLSSTSNIEKINKRIDWDYIHELMQKYSPETPLIDPSQFDPRTPRKVER